MRIVTDGKYFAVKRGWLNPRFLDINNFDYWWFDDSCIEKYCWGTLEQAQKGLEIQKNGSFIRKHWKYNDNPIRIGD